MRFEKKYHELTWDVFRFLLPTHAVSVRPSAVRVEHKVLITSREPSVLETRKSHIIHTLVTTWSSSGLLCKPLLCYVLKYMKLAEKHI